MSAFDQTPKFMTNRVCAIPLWMLQVPRPEARPVHKRAREFCVRIGSKIKSKVTFVATCFRCPNCRGVKKSVAVFAGLSYGEANYNNPRHFFSSMGCLRGLVPETSFSRLASGITV